MEREFDSSELLSEEDRRLMRRVETVRKHIKSYLRPEAVVAKIRELVDASGRVGFASERDRKFIDPRRPVFSLAIRADRLGRIPAFSSQADRVDFMQTIVYEDVISKLTPFLLDQLKSAEDGVASELVSGDLPKGMEVYLISSMFGLLFAQDSWAVKMEYMG